MKCRRLEALAFQISNKGRLSGITAKTALNRLYFIYCVSHSVFMKNLLWLDDIRNPFLNLEGKVPQDENGNWYNVNWVLNYEQFTQWIEMFGLPDAISFDHDLADEHYTPEYFWDNYEESKKYQEWKSKHYQEKTGMDCAKWLVDYCLDNKKQLPEIFIHSANPVGADNIRSLLTNFVKHCG